MRAALGRGHDVDEGAQVGVVAGVPAQGDVDAEIALDLLRVHVTLVVENRDGLGEVTGALEADHRADGLATGDGLHVENNLQILTERENISKGNKFLVSVTNFIKYIYIQIYLQGDQEWN